MRTELWTMYTVTDHDTWRTLFSGTIKVHVSAKSQNSIKRDEEKKFFLLREKEKSFSAILSSSPRPFFYCFSTAPQSNSVTTEYHLRQVVVWCFFNSTFILYDMKDKIKINPINFKIFTNSILTMTKTNTLCSCLKRKSSIHTFFWFVSEKKSKSNGQTDKSVKYTFPTHSTSGL